MPPHRSELHELETWAIGVAEQMLREDPEVHVGDYTMATRHVVTATESLVRRCVSSAMNQLDVPAFRAEVVAMLVRHLRGDHPERP